MKLYMSKRECASRLHLHAIYRCQEHDDGLFEFSKTSQSKISQLLSVSTQTGLIWNSPDLIVSSNEDQLDGEVVQVSSQTFFIGKTVCKAVHIPGIP